MTKIIALDYDDTYTADPELWDLFIAAAVKNRHLVVCVTFRYQDRQPIDAPPPGIELFYTGGQPKGAYMAAQGLMPDIWIDDMPDLIGPTRRLLEPI
ncbi:hypothetical protein RD110_10970 [Rhodoferax koreense]|uniref:Uncharacterized protein n=1 Tax=Rhodoferax koreensis TaxID=1842727 RepID=A0A1P8JV56_9BURK|nr:hypothetical protein [Rhodoferax koreense]APW37649.1 hypothetical protein RD110_10970 [Rhodoferax koreense]